MIGKRLYSIGFFGCLVVNILVLIINTPTAHAQCGSTASASSCILCHDVERIYPVFQKGEWHTIHARKDCCWYCHGGNTRELDMKLAHKGMKVTPLDDIYTACHSCHPDDYTVRAEKFALSLWLRPESSPTPTLIPVNSVAESPIILIPAAYVTDPVTQIWIPAVYIHAKLPEATAAKIVSRFI
jgi:hypothetical protein